MPILLPKKQIEIFRIENNETKAGMWYDGNGKYDPFIFQLTEGISKDLPMEEHSRYRNDGKVWFSGCIDANQFKTWFSKKDIEELLESNYKFYKHLINDYVIEEHQVTYTKEGIIQSKIIQISDLWDIEDQNQQNRKDDSK